MVQPPAPARNAPTIQVQGDVQGSIVHGNGNLVVNTNHGTIYFNAPTPQVSKRNLAPPPPRAPLNFLNRTQQVSQTTDALLADEPVAVHGPDGIGKTALVKHVASHLPRDKYPAGFILLNGARETGVPQTLDDLAQTAFDALFESNPPLKVTATTARTYLGNVRACFLLDHLALAPDALDQLPDLFSTGGVMWAGLQPPRGQTARAITLSGLPRADAITLFTQTAQIAPTPADQSILNQICHLLDDLPLAIVTLARWVREKHVPLANALSALQAQTQQSGGIARALGAVIAALSNTARLMFGLAANIRGAVIDRAALITASGLVAQTAGAAVDELLALGLIQAHSPEVGMHPALKDWARQRVPANAQRVARLNEIILRAAQNHARDVNYLRGQLGNLFGGLLTSANAGNVQQVGAFARVLIPVLVLSGEWDVWQRVFTRVLEIASQSDRALQGWALHELGTRALALKDLTTARQLLTQALRIRQSIGDQVGVAYTQHNLNFLIVPPPPQQPSPQSPTPSSPVAILATIGGGLGILIVAAIVLAIIFYPPRRPTPPPEIVIVVTAPPPPSQLPSVTPTLPATLTPSVTPSLSPTASVTPSPSQPASVIPSVPPSHTPDLPPSAPLLFSPVNDKVEPCNSSPTTVLLRWDPVPSVRGIAYYEWTVERSSRGIYTPFYDDAIDSASVFMILACGYSYRWRVRAIDNNQNIGAWSVYGQFFLAAEPTPVPTITPDKIGPVAPGLVLPLGDVKLPCIPITFNWTPVSDPSGVAFYEWAIERWVSGAYTNYASGTPSGTSTTSTLSCGFWYHWRVRAVDSRRNVGAWSNWGQFYVSPPPTATPDLPPPVPSVISPTNSAKLASNTPTVVLRWNPSSASDLSRYEWELERSFGESFIRLDSGSTTTTSVTGARANCYSYRWRVRAVDQKNNYSNWSPYAYFSIQCPGPS